MQEYRQQSFTGERALYAVQNVRVTDCTFSDGESPLKESHHLALNGDLFRWRYPLWYCTDVVATDCTWFEGSRAGMWYTDRLTVERAIIQSVKNFRRCHDLVLRDVTIPNAVETIWHCDGVRLENVTAKGDYFAMNSENLEIDGLRLDGHNSFDGVKNVVIRNSRLVTKDAFWNSENVTVYDSLVIGEYLGWNAKNLTLINCTIVSLQGLCYVENLKLVGCKLLDTTLAFEYASVDADVTTAIDSVLNPISGVIRAPKIRELILEPDRVDPAKTTIECDSVDQRFDRPEWLR